MNPIIYYRRSLMDREELKCAERYFECTDLLSGIGPDRIVIGRFSLWPFYLDQEREILARGSRLINSYSQHQYVADLINYTQDLGPLTPETWTDIRHVPDVPVILKGQTNSKKQRWNEMMFAPNREAAIKIQGLLMQDGLIGDQEIYIRRYVPLVQYCEGLFGLPITKEFRVFVMFGKILTGAYYWQNYLDQIPKIPDFSEVPQTFLNRVIEIISPNINAFVMDIAQTLTGEWIVVELNDFQQSGLSCNEPDSLYREMSKVLYENRS